MVGSPPHSSSDETLTDELFRSNAPGTFRERLMANRAMHRRTDELLGGAFNPFKDKAPPLILPKAKDDSVEMSDDSMEMAKKNKKARKESSSGEDDDEPSELLKTLGRNSLLPVQNEDAPNRRSGAVQNFMQRLSMGGQDREERLRNLLKTPELPKNPLPLGRNMISERQMRMEAGLPIHDSPSEDSVSNNSTLGRRGMDCSTPKSRSRPLSLLENLDVSSVLDDSGNNAMDENEDTINADTVENASGGNDTVENENTVDSEDAPVLNPLHRLLPLPSTPDLPHFAQPTASSLRKTKYLPPPKAPQVSRKTTSSGGEEIPKMDVESDEDQKNRSVAGRANHSIISIGIHHPEEEDEDASADGRADESISNHHSDEEDHAPVNNSSISSDRGEEEHSEDSEEEEVQLKPKKATRKSRRLVIARDVLSDEEGSLEWDGDEVILRKAVFRSNEEPGLRRSKRARMAPVRQWLGERAIYTRSANGDFSLKGTNKVVVKLDKVIEAGTTNHAKVSRKKI